MGAQCPVGLVYSCPEGGCGWLGWTRGLAVSGPRSHTSEPARMRSRQAPLQGEGRSEAVLLTWGRAWDTGAETR